MDFTTAKPRAVEAYLRESVRRIFGDETENRATITSSHGYYRVFLYLDENRVFDIAGFRKQDASRIVKALRALGDGAKKVKKAKPRKS